MTQERDIESWLIGKLSDELKYSYRPDIRDRAALERNFREKFQALNLCKLTDSEFARLRDEIVSPDVFLSSLRLRQRETFIREDGTPLQYSLVNIKDWCRNDFEVVNQLRMNTENSHHRYDVLLLINGLPVVQIELKAYEVSPRVAMQQIVDYKKDPGNGYTNSLLCFVQLFIVSNRTNTQYFTNNNSTHFSFNAEEQFLPVYQFADEKNKPIAGLDDFAEVFLGKCRLAEMISKYMVLVQSEQKLLMMRPYQIYAVKAIVNSIKENRGNGYIWHTTGSGKTLTSFKASTLLKDNDDIEKCLFVVDRKDLDRQTREVFNKFQEGCVEENTNTDTLVKRMLSDYKGDKVIVTTIQKLGLALDPSHPKNYKDWLKPLSEKRVVFIFDECHRSQFGENHKAIKEFFPKAQLFGFTGTPIFEENATYKQVDGTEGTFVTTKDIFQHQLHAYTITNAIEDRNVLKFHIDYFEPEEEKGKKKKEKIEKGSLAHKKAVVRAILKKHDAATHHRKFNAVLATGSINEAIEYYGLFKTMQTEHKTKVPDFEPLNIACVFSPPAEGNKDAQQLQEDLEQEKADNKVAPDEKKAALKEILDHYNRQYKTNHTITEFDLYYKDVQQRIKFQKYSNSDHPRSKKIDVTIVVDMLLTGFDSPYLNTLYVDKNLKYHGLIQAFSRTNRILNGTKPYGNILDFRNEREVIDQAILLFSGEQKDKAKGIWLVDPAPVVIEHYEKAIAALGSFMRSNNVACEPQEVYGLQGDDARLEFVKCFKEVQRLRTQLDQYTDLNEEQQEEIEELMPTDTLRQFKSSYLETAKQLRDQRDSAGGKGDSGTSQLDFELVLFASTLVDYDYIMGIMARLTDQKPEKQKMTRDQLIALIASDAKMMDEREDLTAFINALDTTTGRSVEQIKDDYLHFKAEKNAKELSRIARSHQLPIADLQAFVNGILDRMIFDGEKLTDLLLPLDLGWKERRNREMALMQELVPVLKKQADGREISGLKAYE